MALIVVWVTHDIENGARDRNRTCDLRVTSALLYRLSYTGGGLNLAPVPGAGNFETDLCFYDRQKKTPQFSLRGLFYNVEAIKQG